MTLKGVTLAEKLRLAQEAGVSLPHYTNTDNPVDFPRVEAKMNKKLRQFEKESKLEIFGLGAKRIPWEAALEKFAELIVKECIDIAQDRANFPGFPPNDVNDIIDEIREHFGVEE